MKKGVLFALIIAGLASTMALTAFTSVDTKEYILLEIYEVPSYMKKGIYIHKGNGTEVEYIPFHEFIAENHDENGEMVINTVNRLVKEGYHIEHVTSGVAQSGMITKIFMHK